MQARLQPKLASRNGGIVPRRTSRQGSKSLTQRPPRSQRKRRAREEPGYRLTLAAFKTLGFLILDSRKGRHGREGF